MTDDDIHVRDFARLLATLEPHLPISDQYELDLPQKQGVWMAEALWEGSAVVQAAADAAWAESNSRRRPGLLRLHLPWRRIAELARSHLR